MSHITSVFAICSSCLLLIGCSGYDVTVNEQPVRGPRPALAIQDVIDPNLVTCLQQTITDRRVERPDQLRLLVCTNAGIETVEGLGQFSRLRQLDLSQNELTRVDVLADLQELELLRVEGNPDLRCEDLDELTRRRGDQLSIARPEHCR